MAFIDIARILLHLLMVIDAFHLEANLFDNKVCNKLGIDPFFKADLIIGKPWIIYYVWNFKTVPFFAGCQKIKFKNATSMIINRIWNDMYEYLQTQPNWSSAILLMTIGTTHEMLLFNDNGVPGSFIGVANVLRTHNLSPKQKHSIPLFKIQMKILGLGQWLIISDCNIGISSLAARDDLDPISSQSIVKIAKSLGIGEGNLICRVEPEIDDSTEFKIFD